MGLTLGRSHTAYFTSAIKCSSYSVMTTLDPSLLLRDCHGPACVRCRISGPLLRCVWVAAIVTMTNVLNTVHAYAENAGRQCCSSR